MKYSHIIWDWNGTLLNDVAWCVEQMNKMLLSRNKRTIDSLDEYRKIFSFPVIDYYRNVGFDFAEEPFEALAGEYIRLYHESKSPSFRLYENTGRVLEHITARGISQVILSASDQAHLDQQISAFRLAGYFKDVLGMPDIYAKGKIDIGKKYIAKAEIGRAVMIGDTTHDFEVSQALGIDCLLVAQGHQSGEILSSCGVPVLYSLEEVIERIA